MGTSNLHFWIMIMIWCSVWRSERAHSCTILWEPMDCTSLGPSVHGIFQARILERVAISYSRGSSWPWDWTQVSCTGRWILYHCDTWHTYQHNIIYSKILPIASLNWFSLIYNLANSPLFSPAFSIPECFSSKHSCSITDGTSTEYRSAQISVLLGKVWKHSILFTSFNFQLKDISWTFHGIKEL